MSINYGQLLGGRYELGDVIGYGGMADVYTATDTLLGRDVAIKMMRVDLARDDAFVERFRREAQNAAKLNHSSIVAVFDTGETDTGMGTVPYIVMELVRGETLRDILRREGTIDPNRAAGILAPVCDALNFSHRAGIIHRDIKPANIMITTTGDVKVMDFGIARALGDTTSMTQTAAVIGTAQYLSPEQARGKPADGRSDTYAVGCVLYECVTGEPPFIGETPLSVAYQHVQDMPDSPSAHIPELGAAESTAVDSVVLTAMAKDPAERYDTADDMAKDLRRLQQGQVPLAAANHIPPQGDNDANTTEFIPQAGAAAGAAGAAAMAGGAENGPSAGASGNQDLDRNDSGQPAKRRRIWPIVALLAIVALLGGAGGALVLSGNGNGFQIGSSTTTVPEVAGMEEDQATQVLEDSGFNVQLGETPDPDVPEGLAVTTDPGPGTSALTSSTVTLLLSSGPEIVDLPDVRGIPAADARDTLLAAGFVVDPVMNEVTSEDIAEGDIVEQNPAAGDRVSLGTTVQLTASSGSANRQVPDVTGLTVEDARNTLEAAGFEVQVIDVDGVEPSGRVITTQGSGSTMPVGSTVEIEVSRGNQMRMPSVIGMDATEVGDRLRDDGFTGSVNEQPVNTTDLLQVGEVAGQSPSSGSAVSRNGTVTVEVYRFGL